MYRKFFAELFNQRFFGVNLFCFVIGRAVFQHVMIRVNGYYYLLVLLIFYNHIDSKRN